MINHIYRNGFFPLLLALILLAAAAEAQKLEPRAPDNRGKDNDRAAAQSVKLEILEVLKDDVKATSDPKSPGRLVPVSIRWKITLPGLASLTSLKARLITRNTDGSKTEIDESLPNPFINLERGRDSVKPFLSVINLPMPRNVFAKDFQLTLKAEVSVVDDKKTTRKLVEQAFKSASFGMSSSDKAASRK